jgi:DNA-binding NarL/FixJ family response regulator
MTGPTRSITVVVADDHPVYRAGVVRALKESGTVRVVAEATDGRAALAAIREHQPAVALLDYRMPELDGLDVVNAVTRDGLPTHIILLTAFDDAPLVYKALAAGASGYLTKESDSDEIVAAIVSCAKGAGYVPTQLASGLANEGKGPFRPAVPPRTRDYPDDRRGAFGTSDRRHTAPRTLYRAHPRPELVREARRVGPRSCRGRGNAATTTGVTTHVPNGTSTRTCVPTSVSMNLIVPPTASMRVRCDAIPMWPSANR